MLLFYDIKYECSRFLLFLYLQADISDLQKEFQDRCEQIACLTVQLCQADENLKKEV